jgi:hypothetical protein
MPGFDGTGPRGLGSMTGRGEGFCILKLPEWAGNDPAAAVYHEAPVVAGSENRGWVFAQLQGELQRIEAALQGISLRLQRLGASPIQRAGAKRQ